MAQARNAFALSLLLTTAGGFVLPTAPRAEPPGLPIAVRQAGLIGQLRTAMGLSPEPGQPMRLLPPDLAEGAARALEPAARTLPAPVAISPSKTATGLAPTPSASRHSAPLRSVAPPVADPSRLAEPPATAPQVSTAAVPKPRPAPPHALAARLTPARPAIAPAPALSPPAKPPRAARLLSRSALPGTADGANTPRGARLAASYETAAPVPRRHPIRSATLPGTAGEPTPATGENLAPLRAETDMPEAVAAAPSAASTLGTADETAENRSAATIAGPIDTVAAALDPLIGFDVFASPREAGQASAGGPNLAIASYSGGGAETDKDEKAAEDMEEESDLPPPPPSELPRLMRVMSALQDDIARGASSALKAQRVLSQRVADTIAHDSDRTLAVPANARALLHYALTGGSPVEVRKAVSRSRFRAPYDALMAGALAFLEGRQSDARRHFANVDLAEVDSVVEGPLRLALAALSVEQDPRKALLHLDFARHSAPGTLVEEAALRRAVLIAAETNDIGRFENDTDRYLRKFSASAYAGNFRRRLVSALTRMAFLDEPNGFERLDRILSPMSPDGKREIYLDLARSAVESGRSAVAARAARLGREIAPSDSLDAQRAELYLAAADVVDPGLNDAAVATLGTLDVARLPKDDQVLRTAALRLGQAVGTLPEPALPPLPPESLIGPNLASAEAIAGLPPLGTEPASALVEDEPSAVEQRVATTLAEIDAILRTTP